MASIGIIKTSSKVTAVKVLIEDTKSSNGKKPEIMTSVQLKLIPSAMRKIRSNTKDKPKPMRIKAMPDTILKTSPRKTNNGPNIFAKVSNTTAKSLNGIMMIFMKGFSSPSTTLSLFLKLVSMLLKVMGSPSIFIFSVIETASGVMIHRTK